MTMIFSRRIAVAGAAALSVLAIAPATASIATDAAPVDAAAGQQGHPTTRYCVLIPASTGTIISRKICHTRDQWLATGFDPLAKQQGLVTVP